MKKVNSRTQKAYKNADFLNSPEARVLRIASEFLEPMRRFRFYGVRDTIVFFGSARTKAMSESKRTLREIQAKLRRTKHPSATLQAALLSAQTDVEMSRYHDDAIHLARMLTQWSKRLYHQNRFVVCSGGGPGIMEAANRGAHLAKGRSIGLNISLPFEQSSNPYVSKEFNFEFHYFFMRKFWFAYLGKAFVMFPGGFGTLDEVMEILTLLQTSKIKKKVTVVLYGRKYWNKIIDFESMVRHKVITKSDLQLFTYMDTPQEAFKYLVKELKKNYPEETAIG